jgi:hypothetical protein
MNGSTAVSRFDFWIGHVHSIFEAPALKTNFETKCSEPVTLYCHFSGVSCQIRGRNCHGFVIADFKNLAD